MCIYYIYILHICTRDIQVNSYYTSLSWINIQLSGLIITIKPIATYTITNRINDNNNNNHIDAVVVTVIDTNDKNTIKNITLWSRIIATYDAVYTYRQIDCITFHQVSKFIQ